MTPPLADQRTWTIPSTMRARRNAWGTSLPAPPEPQNANHRNSLCGVALVHRSHRREPLTGSASGRRRAARRLIALSRRLGRGIDRGRFVVIAHTPDHAGQHGQCDERSHHPAGVVAGSGLMAFVVTRRQGRIADQWSGGRSSISSVCCSVCHSATSSRAASHRREGKPKLPHFANVQRRIGGLTSIIAAPPFSGTECGAVSRPLGPPPACGFELLGAPVIWFGLP